MRITTGRLVAPALFLTTALLVACAEGALGKPGKEKEPGKEKKAKDKEGKEAKGEGKGAKDLRKTYDKITAIAQTAPAGREAARLFDHTKALYRAAVRAYPDDPRRSRELAAAAHDAARGLEHLQRAAYQPVANLPEPPSEFDGPPRPKDGPKDKDGRPPKEKRKGKDAPPKGEPKDRDRPGDRAKRGPWTPAIDALTNLRGQFEEVGAPTNGTARDFFDAARSAYRQARNAYEDGDYRKAAELARAADAWLRTVDHLKWGEWDGPAGPLLAPEPRKKGAPPLPPS